MGTQGVLFFQWLTGDSRFNASALSLEQEWRARRVALDERVGLQVVLKLLAGDAGLRPLQAGLDNRPGC